MVCFKVTKVEKIVSARIWKCEPPINCDFWDFFCVYVSKVAVMIIIASIILCIYIALMCVYIVHRLVSRWYHS